MLIISEYYCLVNQANILFLAISLYVLHIYQQNRKAAKLGNLIPGEKALPFFGNIFDVIKFENDGLLEEIRRRSRPFLARGLRIGRTWAGSKLIVFIANAEDAEIFLNSREHIDKSDDYEFFKPWLGNGLLISTGEKWRQHRQLIAPAFHQNVLKSFLSVFNRNSIQVCDEMAKECGTGFEFDIHAYMNTVTVDILMETAMGIKKIKEESCKYGSAVLKLCELLQFRQFKVFIRPNFIFNFTPYSKIQKKLLDVIHGLSSKMFKLKKEEFINNARQGKFPTPTLQEIVNDDDANINIKEQNFNHIRDDLDDQDEEDIGQKRRLAFLDLMIETSYNNNEDNLSEEDIKDQVDTIMFEGHDTTSAGSSFVFCLLGLYQNVQEKVFKELQTIFGDSNRPATLADTIEMKYLERVILETLRLYPPVPVIARKINRDVKIVSNRYTVPSDSTIVIAQFEIHRDPKYFPDPEKFDPERHLPESSTNRHFYSFIPFSAGPRSCIGRKYAMLKLKILISSILRNYKFYSTVPREKYRLRADIILKRTDGFMVSIEKRGK